MGPVSNQAGTQNTTNMIINYESSSEDRYIAKLSHAEGAAFNSYAMQHMPLCLPDTRVDLLHQLQTWADDVDAKCIFWLNGMAGTGKSTIARTIAREFFSQKRLGGSFFFSRGAGNLGHAAKFFSTLAFQLAKTYSLLKSYICMAITEHEDIAQQAMSDQWKHLILGPLSRLAGCPLYNATVVLVIDALDECEHQDDIRVILQLFAEAKSLNTVRLRIFITSRLELPNQLGFRSIPTNTHEDFILHNISQPTIDALSNLLGLEQGNVEAALRHLRSVLDVSDEEKSLIRLLHPSFLLDRQRCQDDYFWINNQQTHSNLSKSCLRVMSNTLRRDICNLQMPGARVDSSKLADYLPSHVQYACRYWVHHLAQLNSRKQEESGLSDNGTVHIFFQEHFHHWLEALSLMRKMPEGILMVTDLLYMLIPSKTSHPQLLAILQDAKRFILYNRSIIEKAPLQVYASALVFSPQMSLIRRQFSGQTPTWIDGLPIVEANWSLSLQTLEGHTGMVEAVAFSPDGQLLASAGGNTVRFWDAKTGALQRTLECHDWVRAVAFSPDGQLLALGFDDKTVRLRDTLTGVPQHILKGHNRAVRAVAFSPDGQLLASVSDDETVRLWNTQTGALQCTLWGQGSTTTLSFSNDGSRLITNNGMIELEIPLSDLVQIASSSCYSINNDRSWISWKGHDILWIPREYRPIHQMFQENAVALGQLSGRVTVIRFKPDISPI